MIQDTHLECYLTKRPIGKEKKETWILSTTKYTAISLFGEEDSGAGSFSAYDGSKKKSTGMSYTYFLNCSDEKARRFKEMNDGSSTFMLILQLDDETKEIAEDTKPEYLTLAQYADQFLDEPRDIQEQEQEQAYTD